jgi:hypothetical protein
MRKLEFVENYNFNEEDDKSWSFVYKRKKAFILNFNNPINEMYITPFFIRRDKLEIICNDLYYDIEHNIKLLNTEPFFSISIEVIGNMLDNKKMGSPENFINYIWDDVKKESTNFIKIIGILSNIITMIDLSVVKQLETIPQDKLTKIHNDFFNSIKRPEEFLIENDEYDLANMVPINREEI